MSNRRRIIFISLLIGISLFAGITYWWNSENVTYDSRQVLLEGFRGIYEVHYEEHARGTYIFIDFDKYNHLNDGDVDDIKTQLQNLFQHQVVDISLKELKKSTEYLTNNGEIFDGAFLHVDSIEDQGATLVLDGKLLHGPMYGFKVTVNVLSTTNGYFLQDAVKSEVIAP